MSSIRVLLVDDHRMVLEGLRVLLEPLPGLTVVGAAASAAEALTAAEATRPEVVLLDINLPDGSGIDVCRQLTQRHPGLRVIGLTTLNERSYLTRMVQAGAAGYLLKNALAEELAAAIAAVHAGKRFFSDEVQELLLLPEPPGPAAPVLTRREKEVLGLIAEGLTSQAIANKLFLSLLTVESHRRNLLTKFGAGNTAALIRLAVQHQQL